MPSLLDRLTNRIELFKLESRYTRNRNRRSTFVSDSVYVDGEYLPASSQNTGSSYNSRSSRHASNINVGNQGRRYNIDGHNDAPMESMRDRVIGTEGSVAEPYQAMNRHKMMAEKVEKKKRESVMFTNASGESEQGGDQTWGSNNPWNSHKSREDEIMDAEFQREREAHMEEQKRERRRKSTWGKALMPATEEEKAVKRKRRRTIKANRESWMGE